MPKYKVLQTDPSNGGMPLTTEVDEGYEFEAEHGFFHIYGKGAGTSVFGCPLHLLINVTEVKD